MAEQPTQPARRPSKEEAVGAYVSFINAMGAKEGTDPKTIGDPNQFQQTLKAYVKTATREEYQQVMQAANLVPVETRIRARERMLNMADYALENSPDIVEKMQKKFPDMAITPDSIKQGITKMADTMMFPKPVSLGVQQQPDSDIAPEQDGQENAMNVQSFKMPSLMTTALMAMNPMAATVAVGTAVSSAVSGSAIAAGGAAVAAAAAAAPLAASAALPVAMTAIPIVGPALAAAYTAFKMGSNTPEAPANNGPVDMTAGTTVQPVAVPSTGANATSQTR
jgi:hypothetical protein